MEMFIGGHPLRTLGSKALFAALFLWLTIASSFAASAPIATSVIPSGAVYANISGPAYQLNVVPGTTYIGVVTNAGAFIQDNNFVNYVVGGNATLFVAPAGSQSGGPNPLYAIGGTGTSVGGAVQEQVYAVTTVANITASNLVAVQSFSSLGPVSTPMVFSASTSNQVAVGSSPTNGIDFVNGNGINFDVLGSPFFRVTNDVAHSGPAVLMDTGTLLGWGQNGANMAFTMSDSPLHGGDAEFIFSTGNSIGIGVGIGLQGKSIVQMGSAGSTHEIWYLPCDGTPGNADSTGEGWSAFGLPSKSLVFQSGYFSNSTIFLPQITLRSETTSGTNGPTELRIWNSTQTLRATNSSVPGTEISAFGAFAGNTYFLNQGTFTNIGNAVMNGTLSIAGGIVGATGGTFASAGNVGERLTNVLAVGSATSLVNNTVSNVLSLTLTTGDWDVSGNINFIAGAATVTGELAGISTTSFGMPTDGSEVYSGLTLTTTTETNSITVPPKQITVGSTTVVYLMGKAGFSAGTMKQFGRIQATRVR